MSKLQFLPRLIGTLTDWAKRNIVAEVESEVSFAEKMRDFVTEHYSQQLNDSVQHEAKLIKEAFDRIIETQQSRIYYLYSDGKNAKEGSLQKNVYCEDCGHCVFDADGNAYCDEGGRTIVKSYETTANYMYCQGAKYKEREEPDADKS